MQRILRPDVEVALQYLDKLPDYASVFGKDPRAAYTMLALATLLSGVGWMWLPNTSGLRHFVTSQLICTALLTFVGLRDIRRDILASIASITTLVGLSAMLFSSSYKGVQASAEIASWTSIFSWTMIFVLPGLSEPQKAIAGILFFLVLMICIGTITVRGLDDQKEGSQPIISTMTAARIIFINTFLLIASRLM